MMPLVEVATGSALGVVLGMRHALEPDHLAAVSTLVSEQRSPSRAALLGLSWGLGHTLALVGAGAALVALQVTLPPRLADLFEFFVALMLVALGCRAILRALSEGPRGPSASHAHAGVVHRHPGAPHHVHVGALTLARRPLIVGIVHGLAGSGALTALALAALPTTLARVAYMALFGLGSALGMAALSGLLGWPLARLGGEARTARTVSMVVGVLSAVLGIAWGAPLVGRLVS